MTKKQNAGPLPQETGATNKTRYNQPNTFKQNWQPPPIRRMIKRVLVRMAVLGLIPVFVVEAILGRLRRD